VLQFVAVCCSATCAREWHGISHIRICDKTDVCAMIHAHGCQDSVVFMTWLIQIRRLVEVSFYFLFFFIDPVIRLIRMCDVTEIHMSNTTHSYIHTCGMTYSYVWHQGVAVHYSALQRAAVRCSALWCVAVRCSALLQCVEVCSRVQTLDLRDSARCRAKVCICRIFRTSPRSYSLFAAKFWRSACVCSYSKIARPNIAYVDVSWNIQSSGCQKQKKRMPSIKHRQ